MMRFGIFVVLVTALSCVDALTFSVKSYPIVVHPSQVHNRMQDPIPLPEEVVKAFHNKTMGIRSYTVEMYRVLDDGKMEPCPLYDMYNHHFEAWLGNKAGIEMIVNYSKGHDPLGPPTPPSGNCTSPSVMEAMSLKAAVTSMLPGKMKKLAKKKGFRVDGKLKDDISIVSFGGAAGAEFRNNPHVYPKPYAYTVDNPEMFANVLHVINTQGFADPVTHTSKMLECPCTPQRVFNFDNKTIDGQCPAPAFLCNPEFMAQNDTSCRMDTYQGGYRCCADGVFLIDTSKQDPHTWPTTTIVFEFTFEVFDAATENVVLLTSTDCCDVTSSQDIRSFANLEYDVPACPPEVPRHHCYHSETSVQPLDQYSALDHPDEYVELVYAAGHLHLSGISIDLIDDLTGDVLCHTEPIYGNGVKAGDEKGYVVGIEPCVWGPPPLPPPPRLKRSHPMRTVAIYNNTVPHHGVMSLWLMSVAGASF